MHILFIYLILISAVIMKSSWIMESTDPSKEFEIIEEKLRVWFRQAPFRKNGGGGKKQKFSESASSTTSDIHMVDTNNRPVQASIILEKLKR